MSPLTKQDRDELARFAEFLRRVGPINCVGTSAGQARLRAWLAEDPEERRAYLGLPVAPEGNANG